VSDAFRQAEAAIAQATTAKTAGRVFMGWERFCDDWVIFL
jgi:hypothetical protein